MVTSLVVQSPSSDEPSIGAWLEEAGFDVVSCPGPLGPDFECVGGRTGHCPLIEPADVVVVNLRLEGEDLLIGTPLADLVALYAGTGKPLVTYGPDPNLAGIYADAVASVPWPSTKASLLATVKGALGWGSVAL